MTKVHSLVLRAPFRASNRDGKLRILHHAGFGISGTGELIPPSPKFAMMRPAQQGAPRPRKGTFPPERKPNLKATNLLPGSADAGNQQEVVECRIRRIPRTSISS